MLLWISVAMIKYYYYNIKSNIKHGTCQMSIHMNARTQSFSAEHCPEQRTTSAGFPSCLSLFTRYTAFSIENILILISSIRSTKRIQQCTAQAEFSLHLRLKSRLNHYQRHHSHARLYAIICCHSTCTYVLFFILVKKIRGKKKEYALFFS